MSNKNNFKKLLKEISLKFDYFLFGGIAIEVLRGSFTREHSDLDLMINSAEKKNFIQFMVSKGFKLKMITKNFYKGGNGLFEVDILFFINKNNFIIVDGEKVRIDIPFKFFKRKNFGNIDNIKIRLAPMEFLIRTLPYYDSLGDRKLLIKLLKNFDINKIKTIQYTCKRKKNDPRIKEFALRKKELQKVHNINL